uniref:Uncharacterized protein n=1 Tax=Elaeophora elaphi TaxID=1147741 RepID=A0A0R3S765_9BILA
MGCCSSNVFHDEEKGLEDHLFPYLDYQEQADDEYKQLDTENDQKGDTAVEHIFKKTKMVYGQPPKDMRNSQIDWKHEYHIDFKNRPCPYDFPAFEGDKPPDYDENVFFLQILKADFLQKKSENSYLVFQKDEIISVEKEGSKKESEEEYGKGGKKKKSKGKGKGKKKSGGKNTKKDNSKAKKPRRSTNELDQCSLSEKN